LAAICYVIAAMMPARAADATRITTSVEIKHVQPLLRKVAHLMKQGFTRTEADKVAAEIRAMPAEQPMSWSFQVRFEGVIYPLQIRALLDELGTVDLDFATSPALATALRTDVDAYLNSHNL
jgi:hypothetical protein